MGYTHRAGLWSVVDLASDVTLVVLNRSESKQVVIVVLAISCGTHVLNSIAQRDPWYCTFGAALGLKPLMMAHAMEAEARRGHSSFSSEYSANQFFLVEVYNMLTICICFYFHAHGPIPTCI